MVLIPVDDPLNILENGNGNLVATSASPSSSAQVFEDDKWQISPLLSDAIDITTDGVAIRKYFPVGQIRPAILLDGKWTGLERAVPGIQERWKTSPVTSLPDTSPGGWILAHDRPGDPEEPDDISAALLPIRVKGRYTNSANIVVEKAVGVDDFSIGSTDPGASPDDVDRVQDRIWIMAPLGGDPKEIVVSAPVHSSAPVKFSAAGITFDGEVELSMNSAEQAIEIAAGAAATTGSEVLIDLKMGNNTSVSKPLGIKVMKERVVKAVVWTVMSNLNPEGVGPGDPGYIEPVAPDFEFTKKEIEDYLDDVYSPQINASFKCELRNITVRFDTLDGTAFGAPANKIEPGNENLDIGTIESIDQEFEPIRLAGYDDSVSVNFYIVGGVNHIVSNIWVPQLDLIYSQSMNGRAEPEGRICVVAGGFLNPQIEYLDTMTHEAGHLLAGAGHPDEKKFPGPAELPGTEFLERLMCSGPKRRKDGTSRLLVKAEWDKSELWLQNEEDEERIDP